MWLREEVQEVPRGIAPATIANVKQQYPVVAVERPSERLR